MNTSEAPSSILMIKSPLQYLNALEALNRFELEPEECMLVLMADKKSRPQLSRLIEDSAVVWGQIQWLADAPLLMAPQRSSRRSKEGKPRWRNDLFSIIKLRCLASRCRGLQHVFIGDAGNPLMRHFATCVGAGEVVLLDDGVATLKYARWRFSGAWGEGIKPSKRMKVFLKSVLLGLRDRLPSRLTFFTVYSFDVRDDDRLVENRFDDLRGRLEKMDTSDEVYFLGSPLVEAGILSEEEFFWHLKKVADHFESRTLRYVAHRRESAARIEKINEVFGWDTVRFDFPIEYQLARLGPRPQGIASFFSSALENSHKIFGDMIPIVSFKLSQEHFRKRETAKGREVDAIYARYRDLSGESFKLVTL